jgi:protein required for attachment to host cells
MTDGTWIVLANAAGARLYETRKGERDWRLVAELSHPESRLREQDLVSDRSGQVKQSRGYRGNVPGPSHKKLEFEAFARQLADALDEAAEQRRYAQLVLVAPPSFIGLLRPHLSERVENRITATVEKDYAHFDGRSAREQLHDHMT